MLPNGRDDREAAIHFVGSSMALDPTKVPAPLRQLLPVAEKWGIGDDFEREAAVSAASQEELESLVHSIDAIGDDDLFGWLAGPESYNPNPSQEYLALTTLTMAIDSAELKLSRLRGGWVDPGAK